MGQFRVLWGLTSYDNIFYFSLPFFLRAYVLIGWLFFRIVLWSQFLRFYLPRPETFLFSLFPFFLFFFFFFSLLELVLLNASVKQSCDWASGPAGRLSDGIMGMRSWTGQCNVMRYVAVIPI